MNEYNGDHCEICGCRFTDDDQVAEMYDPAGDPDDDSLICHAQCGLFRNYELA